jgi:hypothetical protein
VSRRGLPYIKLGSAHGQTLEFAKQWLRERLDEGAVCPCCTQLAKVYRRPLHAGMAMKLIKFYRAYGTGWGSRVELFKGEAEGDFAKLRYWGLVQESDDTRPDGGRNGWWRVTGLGEKFVLGEHTVFQYVNLYDSRPVHPDEGKGAMFEGRQLNIRSCLGKSFSYNELMGLPL